MGGCATKPKDLNGQDPQTLPDDNSATPDESNPPASTKDDSPAEVKNETAENANDQEEKKEEPLVDLSEPKPEEAVVAAVVEELKLASEVCELKTDASNTDLGEAKDSAPKFDTEEVPSDHQVEKGAAEQEEDKVAAENNKVAEKISEKVEEVANFVKESADHGKD